MLLINTYVAKSDIEGVGVFTVEPVKAGELIWQLDPSFDRLVHISSLDTYPEHFRLFFDRYAYQLEGYGDMLVLEVDNGRFMNHSEVPNTQYTEVVRGYALHDIAAGIELTCNYTEFDPLFRSKPSFPELAHGQETAKPRGPLKAPGYTSC